MARASWTNTSCLGTAIFNQFMSVKDIPPDDEYIDIEMSKLTSLSQAAQTLSAIKTTYITSTKIDRINRIISYIPKEMLQEAVKKADVYK